jgi:tetraacyldisaccharide-1-P 4'-kinase
MPFRDHHQFSTRDIEKIAAAARSTAAAIVLTTEKDGVRFAARNLGDLLIAAMPLTATIEPADAFRAWLFERLGLAGRPK